MLRWGSLVVLAGCAQLAGIDETSKAPDPTLASLQVERVQIGKSIVKSPQDLTALTASFLVPDEAAPGGQRRVAAVLSGTDTWQADIGTMPVPVQFESPELPSTVVRIYDLPSLTLETAVPVLEHPSPEAAPANAMININVGLNTAQNAESYQLFTIGAWSSVGLPAPALGGGTLAATVMLAPNNSPIDRLDRLTVNDAVLLLRHNGNQLVAHYDVAPFDQTDTTSITGAFSATPLDQTLDIRVHQVRASQRLSTVRPALTSGPSYVWRLRASPGLDYRVENGPQLHAASVGAPAGPDPQTITATYGNPFAATFRTLLQWDITANRTYTNATTMQTVTLSARFSERVEPAAALELANAAGLPDRITANGTVLNIDDQLVMAPANAPVEVSFVTDAPANTAHVVQLFELVPDAMTYTLTNVVVVTTVTPQARIPRDLFKDGSLYVLRAFSLQGCYTAIATGDLTQVALPCSTAFADSGVFQVVTP